MARDYPTMDISHLPDLVRLAEQVCATRTPRLLRRDRQELAILMPPPRPPRPSRRRRPRPLTQEEYQFLLSAGGAPQRLLTPVQLRMEL